MNESAKIIEGRIVSYSTSFSALGCRYVVVESDSLRMSLRVPLSFDHLYVVPGTEMYGKVFASQCQRPAVTITYVPASLNEDRIATNISFVAMPSL